MTEPSASRQRPIFSRTGHLLIFPSMPGRSQLPLDTSTCVRFCCSKEACPWGVDAPDVYPQRTPGYQSQGAVATHREIPLSANSGMPAHARFQGLAVSGMPVQFAVTPIKKRPVHGRHSAFFQPSVQPHQNGPQHAAQPTKWQPPLNNL